MLDLPIRLNDKQKKAIEEIGSVVITACPGSGKTRVLTYKLAYELEETKATKRFVVAVTYTRRAAEEIARRIDMLQIKNNRLWTGTLHSFCSDWILRPYSCYSEKIKNGYSVIDEYKTEKKIQELKKKYNIKTYANINTKLDRNGDCSNPTTVLRNAAKEYHEYLKFNKLIDYDLITYEAYQILDRNPVIAKTLANIFSLICVDEYPDTQDLLYGILGKIVCAGREKTKIFLVGDVDQAIYGNLGGMSKTCEEIEKEIGGIKIKPLTLSGCYRTNQKLINYYKQYQLSDHVIDAKGENRNSEGIIYFNEIIDKEDVYEELARIIKINLDKGMRQSDICIVAPRWTMITPCARRLKKLLPNVGFDASGLSPLRRNQNNFWYKIARLYLTDTAPRMFSTRVRWANEIVQELDMHYDVKLKEKFKSGRQVLRVINAIKPEETNGLKYLEIAFKTLFKSLQYELEGNELLMLQWNAFFEGAKKYSKEDDDLNLDTDSLKGIFKEKKGVVINTCHGLKGEEFETVIAFGLLKGYIPHWEDIFSDARKAYDNSMKLLYVICSRAKNNLFLIAERGRKTTRGLPYETNKELTNYDYEYDDL